MTALFPPPQTRTIGFAIVNGQQVPVMVEQAWFRYFAQGLYDRSGGALGASTADLEASQFDDAGIEELKVAAYVLRDQVETMASEINELRERLTVATRQIQDINEGQML